MLNILFWIAAIIAGAICLTAILILCVFCFFLVIYWTAPDEPGEYSVWSDHDKG